MNNFLQIAEKYGSECLLELAVLMLNWESFIEELECKINEIYDSKMDFYIAKEIESGWNNFCNPEVVNNLGRKNSHDYINEILRENRNYFEELNSGEFWKYQEGLKPEIKEFLINRFQEIKIDDHNRFKITISIPCAADIMEESLVDMLDPYEFYKEIEILEDASKILDEIDVHKSENAVEIVNDLLAQEYDLERVQGIYWVDGYKNSNKKYLVEAIIKEVTRSIKRLIALDEQLDEVIKVNKLIYNALDAAIECIKKHVSDLAIGNDDEGRA